MKKNLGFALAGIFVAATLISWHTAVAVPAHPTSWSQIVIHGTPVCILQHAGGIVAMVGECGDAGVPGGDMGEPRGNHHGNMLPGAGLPPGHPPVDPGDPGQFPDNTRRILI